MRWRLLAMSNANCADWVLALQQVMCCEIMIFSISNCLIYVEQLTIFVNLLMKTEKI